MKDLGNLHFFLGIATHFCNDGLFLSQFKYVTELLRYFNLLANNPIATPLATKQYLSTHDGDPLPETTVYRQMVVALQ